MDIWYIVAVLVVVFFSMTIHEVMHGLVAHWLGDTTATEFGRLTLNPLKHVDPFLTIILPVLLAVSGLPIFGGAKPVPFNPERLKWGEWGAAIVAIAGPATNFVLALISFGLYSLIVVNSPLMSAVGWFLAIVTTVNLGFFLFNIIPIPPLDGSRVLFALSPDFMRKIMAMLEQRLGLIIIFVIVMLASPLIGQFMGAGINTMLDFFRLIFGQ